MIGSIMETEETSETLFTPMSSHFSGENTEAGHLVMCSVLGLG